MKIYLEDGKLVFSGEDYEKVWKIKSSAVVTNLTLDQLEKYVTELILAVKQTKEVLVAEQTTK